jgi:hypothetical protein
MPIQLLGNGGTIIGGGEEASLPLHIAQHPVQGNWYRFSGFTGTLTAALAANSEVLQFRFVSGAKSFALIYKVIFDGMAIVVVPTAAGPMGFQLVPARAWTVAGSGGTRIAVSGDNLQMETAAPNSQVNDLGIATTGLLTVGTKTLDANAQGQVIGGVGTAAITAYGNTGFMMPQPLLDASAAGGMPLVLANNEGFVVRTTHAGLAAMTYAAGFTVVWAEVTAF